MIIRAVARTLIGGVYIHIFVFCPTSFFISKETSRAEHENMNIHPPPINALATALTIIVCFVGVRVVQGRLHAFSNDIE